jgi:hypothetical protein
MSEQPPISDHPLVNRHNWFTNRVDFQGNHGEPQFIGLHIQDGNSDGSINWWDYGFKDGKPIQASATVMANRDGSIWRVVRESDAPWTNGDVASPMAEAAELLALPGNPNIWCLTIETEGYSYVPNPMGWGKYDFPQEQLRAVAWQVRTWMDRYDIPVENILMHRHINTVMKWNCPGESLYDYVRQSVGAPVFARPQEIPPPHMDKVLNGRFFRAVSGTVTTARDNWPVLEFAHNSARETRPPLQAGETFQVAYVVKGDSVEGETEWWVTSGGSRVSVVGTVEKPA